MPPIALVLLAWAVLAVILTGCGALVLSLRSREAELEAEPIEAFWVGVAALLCFGNLWHLIRPLDHWFWIIPVIAAAAGYRRTRFKPASGVSPRETLIVYVLLAMLAIWVAGHALQPLTSPDAGVYHVQEVRWYASAAAVPGLGNLNPYVSFNHAFFVLPPAFGLGPFADRGWHLVNGLLVLGAFWLPLAAVVRLVSNKTALTMPVIVTIVIAGRLIDAVLLMALSGPTADVAALAMGAFLLARAASAPQGPAWVSAVLLAALLSLKVTSVAVVLAAGLAEWRWRERWKWKPTLVAAGIAAATLVPWLVHGFVLNGYLVYPIPSLRLPVDWAVPEATARALQAWAWAFARWPGHTAAEVEASGWAMRWLVLKLHDNRDFVLPVGVTLFGGAGLLAAARWRRPSSGTVSLGGAVLMGLALWWVAFPDIRFAGVLLWAMAGVMLGALAEVLGSRRYVAGLIMIALVLGGFVGPEPAFRWASSIPELPPATCVPATLATGEAVCDGRGRACFELNCARAPPAEIATRRTPDFASGFRTIKE